jgi:hypothetical protein
MLDPVKAVPGVVALGRPDTGRVTRSQLSPQYNIPPIFVGPRRDTLHLVHCHNLYHRTSSARSLILAVRRLVGRQGRYDQYYQSSPASGSDKGECELFKHGYDYR